MKTIVYSATAAFLLVLGATTAHGSTTATEQPTPPTTIENPSQPVLSPEQTGNLPSGQSEQVISPKDVLVSLPPAVSPGTPQIKQSPPSLFTEVKPQQISPYAPEVVNTQLPTLPTTTPDTIGSQRAGQALVNSAITRYKAEQKKADKSRLENSYQTNEADKQAAVERERLAAVEQAILEQRQTQAGMQAVIVVLALLLFTSLFFLYKTKYSGTGELKNNSKNTLVNRLVALLMTGLAFVAPKLPRLISKVRPEHFRQPTQVERVRPDL